MATYVSDYLQDGIDDSTAVKNCLKAVANDDERVIIFDKKDWLITEAILLKSNTHVIIDDCLIKQADFTFDNIFRGTNIVVDEENPYGVPKACLKLANIKIEGRGNARISGPDAHKTAYHAPLGEEQVMLGDFWGWRAQMISISNCTGFEISGLSISKTCNWAMSFDLCNNGYIHDIHFDTDVKNGDGIDFRSGCHDCRVENISGKTSDDTVACTALYKDGRSWPNNNYIYPNEPTACITDRTAEMRNISNIIIKNVHTCGMHHGIICLAANGCQVSDIYIENISEPDHDQWREATVKIYTGYGIGYTKGDIHNVTVKNVRGAFAEHAVYSNADVENVYLENITHKTEGNEIKLDFPDGFTVK